MLIGVLIYGGIIALVLVIVGQWFTDRQFVKDQLMQKIGVNQTSMSDFELRMAQKKEAYLQSQTSPFEGLTSFGSELNRQFDQFKDRISGLEFQGNHSVTESHLSFPWEAPFNVKVLQTVRFWPYLHDRAEELRRMGFQVYISTPNQTIEVDQGLAAAFEQLFYQLPPLFPKKSSLAITGTRNEESLTVDMAIIGFNETPDAINDAIASIKSPNLRVSSSLSKSAQLEIHVLMSNIGE